MVSRCPSGRFPLEGSRCCGMERDAPEASVIYSSAAGWLASCPRCRGASSGPRPFGCVAARGGGGAWRRGAVGWVAGARVWGRCQRALLAGGGFEGFVPPTPVRAVGQPRVPLAVCPRRAVPTVAGQPPILRGMRLLPGGGLCGELPVALARLACEWWGCAPVRCGASWTGVGDRWRMISVGRWGPWGLHGLSPYPPGRRLAVLQEAACGCGPGTGQGSLSPAAVLACRPAPLGCEGCLSPSARRIVGGAFCMCQRGYPPRVVAPCGVLGSYGVPFPWGAPGPPGTVVVGVLRLVPASPGTQGWPRCCAFAWRHGCAGPRVGAKASVADSFRPGYRSAYAP